MRKYALFLALLALLAAIFYYFSGSANDTGSSIESDQILMKVLVKESEWFEKHLRIINSGSTPVDVSLEVETLGDMIVLEPSLQHLEPKEAASIKVKVSASRSDGSTSLPGPYLGKIVAKSSKTEIEIPVIVEIETKDVLFDVSINQVGNEEEIKKGKDLMADIRVFNLASTNPSDVNIQYSIIGADGTELLTQNENVEVTTQVSFLKSINIPKDAKDGYYILAAKASSSGSVGISTNAFEIRSPGTIALIKNYLNEHSYYGMVAFFLSACILVFYAINKNSSGKEEKLQSRPLGQFFKEMDKGAYLLQKERIEKAKKHYLAARKIYMDLGYSEKKEAYPKLSEFYGKLKNVMK